MSLASQSGVDRFELALVGGGLQNGLIALAALGVRPERRIALIEAGATLGGNHTWSVHTAALTQSAAALLEPLIVARFAQHDVRFPGLTRTLDSPYAVLGCERFDRVVRERVEGARGCRLLLGRRARRVEPHAVELDDGSYVQADLVIDARGPARVPGEAAGYQKFLGREYTTAFAHGLARPVLIDAAVPQRGGFRFFYVLPLAPDRLLVEDTCFSRSAELDEAHARADVDAYAARFGQSLCCVREECGVLPMPWRAPKLPAAGSPLVAGYAGGFFHPATGYSLPVALRLSLHLAVHGCNEVFGRGFTQLCSALESQQRYAAALNFLLFHAFDAAHMRDVFARFYALPQALIERFYGLSLTRWDRARILLGNPPRGFSPMRALSMVRTR